MRKFIQLLLLSLIGISNTQAQNANPCDRFTTDFRFQINGTNLSVFAVPSSHVVRYVWTFGDGTQAIGLNQTHQYAGVGVYNVCLKTIHEVPLLNTATQTTCVKEICKRIVIEPASPQIDPCREVRTNFTFNVANNSVNFTNTSTHQQTSTYHWDFGDGTFSNNLNPNHTFQNAGTYTVCLKSRTSVRTNINRRIVTRICEKTECKRVIVNPQINPCGDFRIDFLTYNLQGNTYKFTPFSNGIPLANTVINYTWRVDGVIASRNNPFIESFTPGRHIICLKAEKTVVINNTSFVCEATDCDTIYIRNICPEPCDSIRLRYAHIESNDTTKTSIISNVPSNVTVQYTWYWGDGSSSTGLNPHHIYTNPGVYRACLAVTYQFPITNNYSISCRKEKCDTIVIRPRINPCDSVRFNFHTSIDGNNVTGYVYGLNAGTATTTTYTWNFGDNTTGTGSQFSHAYTNAGTYIVCGRAVYRFAGINGAVVECVKEKCDTIVIRPRINPCDSISFRFGTNINNNVVTVTAGGSVSILPNVVYNWHFGTNASPVTGNTATFTYNSPGTHIICVTATFTIPGSTVQCVKEKCDTIVIPSFRLNNNSGMSNLMITPNPVQENANIVFDSPKSENVETIIQTISGQVVYTNIQRATAGNNQYSLNTNNINKGIYLITLKGEHSSVTSKFIKE